MGLPGGARRLDRVLELIQGCRYSLHDLSRVELDAVNPPTPRFNMHFELGLSVCWAQLYPKRHTSFVCETVNRRLQKSLSDLDGTDPNVHGGTVEGVMRELGNAFVRPAAMPTVAEMMASYRIVQRQAPAIQRSAGAASLFEAKVFKDLCFAAKRATELPKS